MMDHEKTMTGNCSTQRMTDQIAVLNFQYLENEGLNCTLLSKYYYLQ